LTLSISFFFAFISNALILRWSGAYVGVAPWLLLSLLQGFYYLSLGFLASRTKNIPIYILCVLAVDEVKSHFPFGGFGWTLIAFGQVDSPFVNIVSLGGVTALSATVLIISVALLHPTRKIFLLLFAILAASMLTKPSFANEGEIMIRAVQGGVPTVGLDFNHRALEVMRMHIQTSKAWDSQKVDVVIWPENAIDIDPFVNEKSKELLRDFLTSSYAPLIAGAVIEKDGVKNAAIKFREDGSAETIYEKRYLTPFGEYMPIRNLAEVISPYANSVTDFSPGDRLVTHSINGEVLASVICYEILNDALVRESALSSGALIVHTNSATFFGTSEGEQQLAITRLRAIEHRRAIVSISTTGPSALINARGEVKSKLKEGERSVITGPLSLNTTKSPSDVLGNTSQLLIFILILFWSFFYSREKT
jgi:apolipoprotein N-acyltransferase